MRSFLSLILFEQNVNKKHQDINYKKKNAAHPQQGGRAAMARRQPYRGKRPRSTIGQPAPAGVAGKPLRGQGSSCEPTELHTANERGVAILGWCFELDTLISQN